MRFLPAVVLSISFSPVFHSSAQTVSSLVNPLVGTAAEGQTFPIAGVPFAMTDWTPQTRDGEVKCVAPYYFADTRIQGFRGSHFLSGSCTQDYGSLTVMPISGALRLGAEERSSAFTHTQESAQPAVYTVQLTDYGIRASITGTVRSGFMRFEYTRGGRSWLVLQANRRPGQSNTNLHFDPQRNEVWGDNAVYRLYADSGRPAGFSGHFVLQFDHPVRRSGIWDSGRRASASARDRALPRVRQLHGHDVYLGFDLRPGEALQVRIGTSFTSVAEARRNLNAEIPGWSFDATATAAQSAWDRALGTVQIRGSAPERRIFYTALYHSLLLPRTFSDVDGSYPRFAGGRRTEVARGFTYYDDYSIWDTFRALHPLLTILDPQREGDMVASLLAKGRQGGFLPIYPAWNSYTSEMIGDHADAIIVDAYIKGIRNFDAHEAYALMRRNATETPAPEEYREGRGRRALASYIRYGYIPLEDPVPFAFHKNEQVSRTLEYAYDDFLVGTMAHALGLTADADLFLKRSGNWRNVIDPSTGFARGRHADGSWVEPFDPAKPASYITESTPFHYTFFVPQDIPGLISAVGGREAFLARLSAIFDRKIYDHGNEPSHHIAYLFNAAGAPALTQQHVRELMDSQYADTPGGLSGNDDCGQMSAWFVMSALGFYSVTPGVPEYEIGTPRFDDVTLHLPNGKVLHLVAKGAEAGAAYIGSIRWNGLAFSGHTFPHDRLMQGGEIIFRMVRTPGTK